MDPMARAFALGLERSHLFVDLFTQGLEGDDWHRRPPGFPNSALWTLGHLAHTRGGFLVLLTGRETRDPAWKPLFDLGCEPRDAAAYPDVDVCRAFLDERLADLQAYLATATHRELEAPLDPPNRFFATGAGALAHLTHHEAHHTGCLSMLRRALGKDKVI